jgi:hypothetical protein
MFIRILRFLAILLTALSMGLSVCHLLEMPVRLNFDPELWVRVTVFEGAFRYFGSIGAIFEVGSVLMAIALSFLVRSRGSMIFYLTLGGALCLVLALASWILFVATANAELARWLVNPIPPDFQSWRRQWEYGHAANAFIKIIGFCLLLLSVIIETPKTKLSNEAAE